MRVRYCDLRPGMIIGTSGKFKRVKKVQTLSGLTKITYSDDLWEHQNANDHAEVYGQSGSCLPQPKETAMTKVTLKGDCCDSKVRFSSIQPGEWFTGSSGTIYVKATASSAIGIKGPHEGTMPCFSGNDFVRPIKEVELSITY